MDARFSLSLKQLILLVLVTAVIVVVLTIMVFLAGQFNALGFIGQASTPTQTRTPTMPPLPKAMTATPAGRPSETYVLTEAQIMAMASRNSYVSPFIVREVELTSQGLEVNGEINYSGYQGELVVSGTPYVQKRRLNFQLESVSVDGTSLPQFLYPTVEEEINLLLEELLSGYDVESIVLQDGQIVAVVTPW